MRRYLSPLLASLMFAAAFCDSQRTGRCEDRPQAGTAPAAFPAGAQMAVVSGDPSKPGPFVVELSMPDGYKIKPHTTPRMRT